MSTIVSDKFRKPRRHHPHPSHDLTHRSHRIQILPNHIRGIVLALSGPAHDLVAPGSDLIAEALHGEDGERLLKLGGELLDPKEAYRDKGCGGYHHNMIPRVRERLVQSEGQEKEPGGEEPGGVAGIEEGHGRRQEALATPQGVLEDGKVGIYGILPNEVHGELFDGHREIVQGAVGTVRGGNDGLGLRWR